MAYFWGEEKPPRQHGRRGSGHQGPRVGGVSDIFGGMEGSRSVSQEQQQEAQLREELWSQQQQRLQQQQQQQQQRQQQQQQQPRRHQAADSSPWQQHSQQRQSRQQNSSIGGFAHDPPRSGGGGGSGSGIRRPSPYRDETSAYSSPFEDSFSARTMTSDAQRRRARSGVGMGNWGEMGTRSGGGGGGSGGNTGSTTSSRGVLAVSGAPLPGQDSSFDARVAAMHERRLALKVALWKQFGGEGEVAPRGELPAFDEACDRAFERLHRELEQQQQQRQDVSANAGGSGDGMGAAKLPPRTPFDADVQVEMEKIMAGLQQQLRAEDVSAAESAISGFSSATSNDNTRSYNGSPQQQQHEEQRRLHDQKKLQQYLSQERARSHPSSSTTSALTPYGADPGAAQQRPAHRQMNDAHLHGRSVGRHSPAEPLNPYSSQAAAVASHVPGSASKHFFGAGAGNVEGGLHGALGGSPATRFSLHDNKKQMAHMQQKQMAHMQQNDIPGAHSSSRTSRGRYSARGNSTFTLG